MVLHTPPVGSVKINLDQGIHQSKSQLAALWERIDFDQAIHQSKTQLAAILQEIKSIPNCFSKI
jgi:hypothetical protein